MVFNYQDAFSRNIGWVTEQEQAALRNKRVAIASMDGICGFHFRPGQMSFEGYFQLGDRPELDLALRFLVGLAPALLHRHYLTGPSRISLKARKGPSTIIDLPTLRRQSCCVRI